MRANIFTPLTIDEITLLPSIFGALIVYEIKYLGLKETTPPLLGKLY